MRINLIDMQITLINILINLIFKIIKFIWRHKMGARFLT
jgi:hypothetical protein